MTTLSNLRKLSPTVFENLTFDILVSSGFYNIIWRTPGSDEGRDIEASYSHIDASGESLTQKWYIECKRYKTAISWPIIFTKIAHAEAHNADYLLLVATSNPSPNCENQIKQWNSNHHLKVRFWRGYQLVSRLNIHPHLSIKYGFTSSLDEKNAAIQPLVSKLLGYVESADAAYELNGNPDTALKLASWITKFIEEYMVGNIQAGFKKKEHIWNGGYESWIDSEEQIMLDQISVITLLAMLRHVLAAVKIRLRKKQNGVWLAEGLSSKLKLDNENASFRDLMLFSVMSGLKIEYSDEKSIFIHEEL